MKVLTYLREHPLVWLIPVAFFGLLVGGLAWKLSRTPVTPFIYEP